MDSKEAQKQSAEGTAVAAQAMKEEEQQAARTRQQNREEAIRAAQASTMWASVKSRVRAASERAILRARQMFGEPKVESATVKESTTVMDESQ